MKKFLTVILALSYWLFAMDSAFAQQAPTVANVVASCGTTNGTIYSTGQNRPITIDTSGKECSNSTVNANISGFQPTTPASTATLSVSSAGATNVALPTGTDIAVTNPSTGSVAYIRLSVGAGTATTSDFALQPGATVGFHVSTNTFINGITTSVTSQTLTIVGGSGLVTGFGGGGGGSTGAVTVANGADAVEGTQTDAAACTGGVTHTVNGCLPQLDADIAAGVATPASAVPAKGNITGGQAGANYSNFPLSQATLPINISTATTTQLLALSGGKAIYVTVYSVVAGGTGNITFEYGTGSTCSVGTTTLTGAIPLVAQSGIAQGNGDGAVFVIPAGNAFCALTSQAVQMSGSFSYSQF